MRGPYLDQVLLSFSGTVAVDELYDGPHAILSLVDNRTFRRLLFRRLDKTVTADDVLGFFRQFQGILQDHHLQLLGITTDGSALYPDAIAQVFGDLPHQVCRFHVMANLTQAARKAVVRLYKKLMGQLPQLKSGRPKAGAEQRKAQRVRQRREQLLELYRRRYALVTRQLKPEQEQRLGQLLEGYPQLAAVRQILQQVYRVYESSSRCEAMSKLQEVRRSAAQWEKQQSLGPLLSGLLGPCIELSLVYLDHPGLPATSNAVERSNRRHRKMQKSVYRVRAGRQIERRLALDLLREQRAPPRGRTTTTLHRSRRTA